MTLTLEIEKRDSKEDNKALRDADIIPAVFYGPKEKPASVKVKLGDFLKVYREAGESTIVSLKDGSEEHDALIHQVDVDPVKGKVRHIDFYIIEKGKKLTVDVPLEFIGESPAEKRGESLIKVIHEVEVEAMPKDLPHLIEVSIESLSEVGSQIHASDLKMPEGVELKTNPEEVVALIQAAKEEEEESSEAPDLDSIEVAGKKKEDKEDKDNKEEDKKGE